jgi:RNA polymerase sigma-70 factor (ECF subfamily)
MRKFAEIPPCYLGGRGRENLFCLEKRLQPDVCFATRLREAGVGVQQLEVHLSRVPRCAVQRSYRLEMGSPLNGRALPFPVIWGTSREDSIATPQPVEVRSPSDEELMASLKLKDAKALDLLFGRYSRLVLGIAVRILNDRNEAEDVVQEVFFSLYQKATLYDPAKGAAKGWVVQVAFSRARDRKTYLARRGFYSGTDIESLDNTLIGQTDVEHEVGVRLDFSQLRCAFEDLTALQRRTLELFYFEGLELREISERLREPFGNVRHHFYRGLERLRKSPAVKRLRDNYNAS